MTASALGGSTMLSSCLVTSSPDFQDPARTRPFLLPDLASPDPRRVIVLDATTDRVELDGFVVGEDAGSAVQPRLLLDYGTFDEVLGKPFQDSVSGVDVPPGSLDGEPRKVSVVARASGFGLTPGCHRLTLMVSHKYDEATGCPSDLDDYDAITWTVLVCDANGICPTLDLTKEKQAPDDPSCPAVTVSCATLDPTGAGGGS